MDGRSFDRLTRALGGASTRRAGLRAALGGLLGGGLAAFAPAADADARRKHRKKKRAAIQCTPDSAEKPCPTGMVCLALDPARPSEGRCMCNVTGEVTSPCGTTCCPAGATCTSTGTDGTCRCGNGYPPCAGRCCASGETCSFGVCVACPAGQTPCGSTCCFDYQSCQSGTCVGCADGLNAPCGIAANCCHGSQNRCLNGQCCAPRLARCIRDSNCCSGYCNNDPALPQPRCEGADPAITPAEIASGANRHGG